MREATIVLISGQRARPVELFVEPWGMALPMKPGTKMRCRLIGDETAALYWEIEVRDEDVFVHANGPAVSVSVEELADTHWSPVWSSSNKYPAAP